jgi:hypothetical protein
MKSSTPYGPRLKFDYAKTTMTKESCLGSTLIYDALLSCKYQPAKVLANGDQWWYLDGKIHREDGPAIITKKYEIWMFNNVAHRDGNLPSNIYKNGNLEWFVRGQRHRTDGPAVVFKDASGKPDEYWIDGVQKTFEEFQSM